MNDQKSISNVSLHSRDLMFTSQIQSTVNALGLSLQVVKSLDEIITEHSLVLIDLETPGLDFRELSSFLSENPINSIAYGPHVKTHLFDAARSASVDAVYSKGQIHANLKTILQKFLSPPRDDERLS